MSQSSTFLNFRTLDKMDNESDVQPRPEFEVRKTVFPDEPEGREPESPTEETNGTNGGLHEEAAPSEDAVEPGKI